MLPPELLAKIRALDCIARRRGQTLAQMALAWCLKDDRVTSVLVGASSVKQLDDDFRALENTCFTSEELREIDS